MLGFKASATRPAIGYNFLRFSNEDPKERNILGANIRIPKIDSCTWHRQLNQRHRDPQNSAQAGRPPTVIFPFQTLLLINYWFLPYAKNMEGRGLSKLLSLAEISCFSIFLSFTDQWPSYRMIRFNLDCFRMSSSLYS